MQYLDNTITETPVHFGESGGLFGITTVDSEARPDFGVIILNAGLLHRVGPFRMSTLISRDLANRGYACARIDQSGKGDSPRRPRMSNDMALRLDYQEVRDHLRKQYGVEQFVLMGLCSGADDAVKLAPLYDEIVGMVLLDGYARKNFRYYIHRYSPKLFRWSSWRRQIGALINNTKDGERIVFDFRDWLSDEEMIAKLSELLTKGTKVLALFTGDVDDYYSYEGQLAANLGKSTNLRERYFSSAKHLYQIQTHRNTLIDLVGSWMSELR